MDLTGLEGIPEESDIVSEWRESGLQLGDMPMNLRERERGRERMKEGGKEECMQKHECMYTHQVYIYCSLENEIKVR